MTKNRTSDNYAQTLLGANCAQVQETASAPFHLLYIGERVDQNRKYLNYATNDFASGFAAAKQLMKDRKNAGVPHFDVIIVDLAAVFEGLNDFSCFLRRHQWCRDTPVLYHERSLSRTDILELGRLGLVDDVVNIETLGQELEQKVRFLHNTKVFLRENSADIKSQKVVAKENSRKFLHLGRRVFDISVALILIILLLPVMALIMIAIKLESKGPVMYCSKRAGRGYRIFDFYKFRTMRANAENLMRGVQDLNAYDHSENNPVFFKAVNDPRVTKVGTFLRNSSLDEIPQLINVIKGDMSLVGNRPLPLYEASSLTSDRWAERFMAPAGMTGLWQVIKRGKKQLSLEERLRLDIKYARQHNLSRDFWILAHTPGAVFQKVSM